MPEMVLNRNHIVRSLNGRSVKFVKNVKTFVPPSLVSAAAAVGAVMADGTAPEVLEEDIPTPTMPVDRNDRTAQYAAAFVKVVAKNARMDFGANGIPTVKAMERLLGWEPNPKDMRHAWAAWREAELLKQEEAAGR